MFHHIRKFSSTVKVSPITVSYTKNNNVVRVMDQTEESKKKPGGGLVDQISLRPFELTDVDDIMVWATDKRMSRYCGGWSIYKSKEEALEDLENYIIPHPWYRAICLENQQPIGKISVESCYKGNPCFGELGYAVATKHWGKGIATAAVKMVLDTIFKEWPHLQRLDALVDVKNLGSLRVLEKAGFKNKGVLRGRYTHKGKTIDMAIFRFLSIDFKQRLN